MDNKKKVNVCEKCNNYMETKRVPTGYIWFCKCGHTIFEKFERNK